MTLHTCHGTLPPLAETRRTDRSGGGTTVTKGQPEPQDWELGTSGRPYTPDSPDDLPRPASAAPTAVQTPDGVPCSYLGLGRPWFVTPVSSAK